MEDEHSRSATSDSIDDDDDFDVNDDGFDDEGTLDEEEALDELPAGADELKDLEAEGEMSLAELRRLYGHPPLPDLPSSDGPAGPLPAKRRRIVRAVPETNESISEEQPSSSQNGIIVEDLSNDEVLYGIECGKDEDDDKDKDYDPHKSQIRVDAVAFQAVIPDFDPAATVSDFGMTALWVPNESIDDDTLNAFILDCLAVKAMRLGSYDIQKAKVVKIRDDEDSLYALFTANYDKEKARISFESQDKSFLTDAHANWAKRSVRPDVDRKWNDADCGLFEKGLKEFGKIFTLVQQKYLPHRKVGELIEFYYTWKKTERYDIYREHHNQKDPHCMDFMQQVCDNMNERAGDGGKKWQPWEEVAHG